MVRTCILCGSLCLTGLHISGRMLCCGCEAALLRGRSDPLPALLALYNSGEFTYTPVTHNGPACQLETCRSVQDVNR